MSTTHALVKVISEIKNFLNKRKHSIGVFIDLQKAFDTVDHQLLCTKLDMLICYIYVNDMCNVSKLLKFILFADDTNIFHSHSKFPDLVSELNTELDKMYKWFCVNKLSLNIAKTNYIGVIIWQIYPSTRCCYHYQ